MLGTYDVVTVSAASRSSTLRIKSASNSLCFSFFGGTRGHCSHFSWPQEHVVEPRANVVLQEWHLNRVGCFMRSGGRVSGAGASPG